MTAQTLLPLALTQGDPSGIGPELAIRAWIERSATSRPFYVLGDPDLLERTAATLSVKLPIAETTPEDASSLFSSSLPVIPLRNPVSGLPGRPDPADAAATVEAIETAVAHVHAGQACAVVTNPIAKEVLYRAGFSHPGHTEFLSELAGRFWNIAPPLPVMLLWSEALAVVPVTIHIPLSAVPSALTPDLLQRTVRVVWSEMRDKFGLDAPRLACAGLNPHAGEAGSLGREELDLIVPALEALRQDGIDIVGPLPADAMFTAAARKTYDVALGMYHDQALIPIKTLAFDEGVNATLGLPFIRTSPDHGTAFAIAGKGLARPDSLQAALRLGDRLASRRKTG